MNNLDNVPVQEVLQFLRTHIIAAIATILHGTKAHATTIYYYTDDDLKMYFLTKGETLKFSNIIHGGSVGLVVTDPQTLQTIQVEGTAKEVDYSKEYAQVMKKYVDTLTQNGLQWANIPLNHMEKVGYYTFVQITPTWIRWTDFKNWAHTVKFEQRFG